MSSSLNDQLRTEVLQDFSTLIAELRREHGEAWMDARVDDDKELATRRWVLATAYKVLSKQAARPAPQGEVAALVAEAREWKQFEQSMASAGLIQRLADALEHAERERTAAIALNATLFAAAAVANERIDDHYIYIEKNYHAMCDTLWKTVEPNGGDDCATIAVKKITTLEQERDVLARGFKAAVNHLNSDTDDWIFGEGRVEVPDPISYPLHAMAADYPDDVAAIRTALELIEKESN